MVSVALHGARPQRCTDAAWRMASVVRRVIDSPVVLSPAWSVWPWRSGITVRWQAEGEDEDLWIHGLIPTWKRTTDGVLWAMLEIDRRGRVVQ